MVMVFGLAFELPLLLVLLNFTGVVSGRRMLGWWRGMVMGITVFAAVATPTGDPLTMSRWPRRSSVLYFLAMGICFVQRPPPRAAPRRPTRTSALDPDRGVPPRPDAARAGRRGERSTSPSRPGNRRRPDDDAT